MVGEARLAASAKHRDVVTLPELPGITMFGTPHRFKNKQVSKHVESIREHNRIIPVFYNSSMSSPEYRQSITAMIAAGILEAFKARDETKVYSRKAYAHIVEYSDKGEYHRTPMIVKDHVAKTSSCVDPYVNAITNSMVHPLRSQRAHGSTGSESFRINRPDAYVTSVRITRRPREEEINPGMNRALIREVSPDRTTVKSDRRVTDSRERSIRAHSLRSKLTKSNRVAYDKYVKGLEPRVDLPRQINPK